VLAYFGIDWLTGGADLFPDIGMIVVGIIVLFIIIIGFAGMLFGNALVGLLFVIIGISIAAGYFIFIGMAIPALAANYESKTIKNNVRNTLWRNER
jgi:hypothetical protein